MIEKIGKFARGNALAAKLFRGGAFLTIGTSLEQVLRFARNMILARLLAPEAFGLMAIILSTSSLIQVLTGIGLKETIVQNPRGAEIPFLNAAWFVNFGRGLAIYMVVFLAAPFFASFYEAPELTVLLRIAFLGTLAQSAISMVAFTAIKRMEYAKWVGMQQIGSCIGIISAVAMAFSIGGVWALVLGYTIEGVARCILSYIFFPFCPRFSFDKEATDAIFKYARGIFGLPVLMLIYTEAATFVLGKVGTKAELGVFALTLALARIPSMFTSSLADLFLPAFSEVQNNKDRMNRGLLKVTSVIAGFSLPLLTFVILFGREILTLTYKSEYAIAAIPFAIIMLNEIAATCNVPIAALFLAQGKPALLRRFSWIRALFVLVLVYPMVLGFGLIGAAITPLAAIMLAYMQQLWSLNQLTGLRPLDYFATLGRSLLLIWPVLIGAVVAKAGFVHLSTTGTMLVSLAVALVIYGVGAAIAYRSAELRNFFWPFAKPDRVA